MKIGIVGLDSSHAVMFARFFNEREAGRLGRVTTAWAGGSQDVALSAGRVAEFTRQVRDAYGVKIVPSIREVAAECDAVLLLSMDGRTHAAQFAEIANAHVSARKTMSGGAGETGARKDCRVYINKPLAASSADARTISDTALRTGVRWFSASMLRCVDELSGDAKTAAVNCPLWWDDGANAGWYWYGMHGVELIYAAMGAGVASVAVRVEKLDTGKSCEIATLRWADGRRGVVRGVLDKDAGYTLGIDGAAANEIALPSEQFERATAQFLAGRDQPVANAETLEIMSCVEAINESRAQGGREIAL